MLFDFSKVGTGERINENTVTRGVVEEYNDEYDVMFKFYGEIIDDIMYVITIDRVLQRKKSFVEYHEVIR